MKTVCKICGNPAYSDYCYLHKPRNPIAKSAIKKKVYKLKRTPIKKKYYKKKPKPTSPFEIAKQDLWDIFSKYIRLRDSDGDGYCNCISCGSRHFWKYGDAGHFVGRSEAATWIHEKNNHFQCKTCNQKHEGRKWEYGNAIEKKYGVGTSDSLIVLSKQSKKYSIPEFKELTELYKRKVIALKREKHLK